ncbi:IS21-like element helper ATPase IstB [Proteiniborus sp. MB09-C3]|uniref:IS21-like element helper ATPase IstB n=1 Tax=Proteiniborus sp. MB09-C3 TaxID=3050072 RepID=UPI0025563ED3|nr:IS21-like element helper ATPase IstB [Proteiniborus sp. MB09-C3]WIV11347.1 IS21-like element helper ATPase IstB [Proteiniborus sp. MB09-C3]WIV12839.1 IS21-like element helper ATPase IstB [Proteiniborus sp. MB09-C3]WIV13236.1 IS21-like element helper ATPase IstB [Proteiniborus sp. MB09-C3]
MDKLEQIKEHAKELSLNYLRINADKIIEEADLNDYSYQDILIKILENEIEIRDKKAQERRLKNAGFPVIKKIEDFDLDFQKSITKKQINRLLEMEWIDRMYNLIFLGPPGVGKTHLSISLGYKAVELGYKVSFVTMDNLMHVLKTHEISRKSKGKMNRILSSSLVIIDELGYLPITREEANLFFQLVSALHEQASIIITSNKGLEDWTELLGDPALTTAVLDRITYRCELFSMSGKSYRLEHRKSLF